MGYVRLGVIRPFGPTISLSQRASSKLPFDVKDAAKKVSGLLLLVDKLSIGPIAFHLRVILCAATAFRAYEAG